MKLTFKKGDITDMLVFVIVLFILAVGLFIFAYTIPTIADGLNDAGLNNSVEGANAITEMSNVGTITIQRGFFLLFMGLMAGTMISAFFVRTHPIFLFLYIIFLAISIFIGTYFGNAYDTLTEIDIFASTLGSQTLINLVMDNLIKITLGVGALSMIIVFAKFSSLGGRGRQDL